VLMAQLNRGPEQRTDHKPQVSDLRESGSLEQDSDMVILVHREEMYDKETTRVGEADLIIGKQRNGPQGIVTLSTQLHIARFVNMARM
jgi:replicative DNA helicase